jgi:hypothetical protein
MNSFLTMGIPDDVPTDAMTNELPARHSELPDIERSKGNLLMAAEGGQ